MKTIEIYTADDLRKFRDRVNHGEHNLNAVLMADIDLGGKANPWVPIADKRNEKAEAYRGCFNICGREVSVTCIRR